MAILKGIILYCEEIKFMRSWGLSLDGCSEEVLKIHLPIESHFVCDYHRPVDGYPTYRQPKTRTEASQSINGKLLMACRE